MRVELKKAGFTDAGHIYRMQVQAFMPLRQKYQDYAASPAAEAQETVAERLKQSFIDYYIIYADTEAVGCIRIKKLNGGRKCRISQICVVPEAQNRGIAQEVFKIIERLYQPVDGWELDTILAEARNCHLYEKLGYVKTGVIKKISDKMTIVYYGKKRRGDEQQQI